MNVMIGKNILEILIMNKQTEALKMNTTQAIDFLYALTMNYTLNSIDHDRFEKSVDVLAKALEQHEKLHKVKPIEQPAQEPVAVITPDNYGEPRLDFIGTFKYKATTAVNPDILLYTHPCVLTHSAPSCTTTKEWVGLSDDEIRSTYKELFPTTAMKLNSALIKYIQTLELILRDKNERT